LSIGLAWTKKPYQAAAWQRLDENPVLGPHQADARAFEQATLYRSNIIWDKSESLGYPFVMFYNGKQKGPGIERIGMAVSNDTHLIEPSEPWDKTFAHKPWVLKHRGVVYHFYCAVGSKGRVIALATSKDLRAEPTQRKSVQNASAEQ
jgi:hypothetical protein